MLFRGPPSSPRASFWPLVAAILLAGCGDSSESPIREPTRPSNPGYGSYAIVHTVDGRHLKFLAPAFQPSAIQHCRQDGRRHLTSIYELRELFPGGHTTRSLCPELSGRFLTFRLFFPDSPMLKVTSLCEDGCVTPGGYYEPLGVDIRIPWSEIMYVEFQK